MCANGTGTGTGTGKDLKSKLMVLDCYGFQVVRWCCNCSRRLRRGRG